jgi:hypothetical protein
MTRKVEIILRHLDGRVFAKTTPDAFANPFNVWPWAKSTVAEEFKCDADDVSEKELANGMVHITVRGTPVAAFITHTVLEG